LASQQTDEALHRRANFESFFYDLMAHLDIEEVREGNFSSGVKLSLRQDYSGSRVLDDYAKRWGVEQWTPLLLARTIAEFKESIGGEATVAAVAPEYFEISQTKCEFGEPRSNPYSGNLCSVCREVALSVASASGLTVRDHDAGSPTIAHGYRYCTLRIAMA
jgi:hypothetical protein